MKKQIFLLMLVGISFTNQIAFSAEPNPKEAHRKHRKKKKKKKDLHVTIQEDPQYREPRRRGSLNRRSATAPSLAVALAIPEDTVADIRRADSQENLNQSWAAGDSPNSPLGSSGSRISIPSLRLPGTSMSRRRSTGSLLPAAQLSPAGSTASSSWSGSDDELQAIHDATQRQRLSSSSSPEALAESFVIPEALMGHIGPPISGCTRFSRTEIRHRINAISALFDKMIEEDEKNSFFGRLGDQLAAVGRAASRLLGRLLGYSHEEVVALDEMDNTNLTITEQNQSTPHEQELATALGNLQHSLTCLEDIERTVSKQERRGLHQLNRTLNDRLQLDLLVGVGGCSLCLLLYKLGPFSVCRNAFRTTRFIDPGTVGSVFTILGALKPLLLSVGGLIGLSIIWYKVKKWMHSSCRLERKQDRMELERKLDEVKRVVKEALKSYKEETEQTMEEWDQSFEQLRSILEEAMLKLREDLVNEVALLSDLGDVNELLKTKIEKQIMPVMAHILEEVSELREETEANMRLLADKDQRKKLKKQRSKKKLGWFRRKKKRRDSSDSGSGDPSSPRLRRAGGGDGGAGIV